ncbi:hypothetical protein BC828DRAFT_414182 [Blastocladiella britannica]|nr:hypothetical protein BC828DRAFT_414182 [Blastocladiella britannica]
MHSSLTGPAAAALTVPAAPVAPSVTKMPAAASPSDATAPAPAPKLKLTKGLADLRKKMEADEVDPAKVTICLCRGLNKIFFMSKIIVKAFGVAAALASSNCAS